MRSYRDLNPDRQIQSLECLPLHHKTIRIYQRHTLLHILTQSHTITNTQKHETRNTATCTLPTTNNQQKHTCSNRKTTPYRPFNDSDNKHLNHTYKILQSMQISLHTTCLGRSIPLLFRKLVYNDWKKRVRIASPFSVCILLSIVTVAIKAMYRYAEATWDCLLLLLSRGMSI